MSDRNKQNKGIGDCECNNEIYFKKFFNYRILVSH